MASLCYRFRHLDYAQLTVMNILNDLFHLFGYLYFLTFVGKRESDWHGNGPEVPEVP